MSAAPETPPPPGPDRPRPPSPRQVARASALEFGLLAAGALHALVHLLRLVGDPRPTAVAVASTLAYVLGDLLVSGLAAWMAGRWVRSAAARDEAAFRQSAATRKAIALIEGQVVPALARVAEALERRPAGAGGVGRAEAVAEVRRAMAAGQWAEAELLAEALASDEPDDPHARALAEEVARKRGAVVEDLRARLDAARGVNDAERVMGLRDELSGHLQGDPLRDLDRQLVPWLMSLVRRGLAQVPLRLDVVQLATQVAERFGGTNEGASLLRSLPVLRRAVGLCPRCARPFAGEEEACPECLGTAPPAEGVEPIEAQPRPSLLEEAGIPDEPDEPS
jgi:hypothetical protein